MALLERLVLALELDANGAVANAQRFQQEIGRALTPVEKLQQQLKLGFNVGLGAAGASSLVDGLKTGSAALGRFLVDSAKAAEEDARSKLVLEQTLRNTTGAYSDTISAVEAYIEKTRAASGVADDELRQGFATLVRSTKDATEAQKLLTLAVDVSAGTGRDLGTITTGLAKAYDGNVSALGRLVPELSAAAREGATFDEVVQRLQQSFGGTQQAINEQGVNATQRLSSSFQEFKETVGLGLVGTLNQAAASMSALKRGADDAAEAQDKASQSANAQARNTSILTAVLAGSPLGPFANFARQAADSSSDAAEKTAMWKDAQQAFKDRFGEAMDRIRVNMGLPAIFGSEVERLGNAFDATAFKVADFGSVLSAAFGLFDAENAFGSALSSLAEDRSSGTAAAKQRALSEFEVESAARSVKQAEDDLAEAEKNLADVRRGASDDEKRRAEQDVANAAQRNRVAAVRLADAENNLRRAQARGTVAEQTKAQLEYEQALLDTQNAAQDAEDAQKRKNETDNRGKEGSKELADAVKRVEDAQWAVKAAYESQRRLFEQDAATGGPGTKVGRSMESAFLSAQKAAGNVIDEMLKAGKPIDDIIAKARELEAANIAAGQAAGLPEPLIRKASAYYDYLVALAKYQAYLNTTFKNGQDPDGYEGLYLKGLVDSAKDRFEAAGRAAGGAVSAGVLYRVNESRAEYFKPTGSGTIVPLTGGGGMGNSYSFNFAGAVIATDADLERLIVDTLERAKRRGWN